MYSQKWNCYFHNRIIMFCLPVLTFIHCKDKMPKIWNKYSQKRNIGASVPISTFMCLWANYIFPRWVCLFCWRKYVDWSWEYINRSQTMNVEIWAEAAQFPEKEYINGIAVAVYILERFKYFQDRSAYFAAGKYVDRLTDIWTWKLGLRPHNSQERNT